MTSQVGIANYSMLSDMHLCLQSCGKKRKNNLQLVQDSGRDHLL